MKKIFTFILVLSVLFLSACSMSKKEEKVLKMGFVPTSNSETLIEDVKPIADKLSEKLGVKVEAFTASNYIGVVEGIGSGSVDFGFLPPFAYLLSKEQSGATPILTAKTKDGKPGYFSYLYTLADSNIKSVEDIRGKKVAFVDPTSTSGYIYPGAILTKAGFDLEKDLTVVFTGGHDKSLQLLLNGDVDVMASYGNVAKKYEKDFHGASTKVKEILKSDLIPGITVVSSSKNDKEFNKKLREAFKELEKDKETMEVFKKMFSITGFDEINEDDYKKVAETAKVMKIDLKKVK